MIKDNNNVDYSDRIGGYMTTYTKQRFYPADPRPQDFSVVDIARGVSNACRFAGQLSKFYSVAQHELLIARYLTQVAGSWGYTGDINYLAYCGLHHDDTEAYMCDLPKPLKNLCPDYEHLEIGVMEKGIAPALGILYPLPVEVKRMDNLMYVAEVRDFSTHRNNSIVQEQFHTVEFIDNIIPITNQQQIMYDYLRMHLLLYELAGETIRNNYLSYIDNNSITQEYATV